MNIQTVTAWTGLGLIICGVGLIVAQIIIDPACFHEAGHPCEIGFGLHSINIQTAFPGLAVIAIGAFLVVIFGRNNTPEKNR
jgi:hypothetical protein